MPRTEEPNSHKVDITLHNVDGALTSLDFEHYQAVISKGYKTGVARTAWAAGTVYAIDDIRVPATANGYQYRCSVAGTSHASTEPTWPTDLGVTVADNTVTWEMDGNSGDEYSRAAPLRVRVQETYSGMGIRRCILRCIGLQDQLKEDKAIAEYTQLSSDTNTVKTLISAICAASTNLSSAYNGYTVITVVYDSGYDGGDNLINTFIPADYFSVSMNEPRWDKIIELLGYTGCKARFENDGKLHILKPVITETTYNYEYKWNVAGDHLFWNKSIRLRFINPNKIIVRTPADYATQYTGSATSATSYALAPKTVTIYARVVSNAQCDSIASAKIEQLELDDEKGIVVVPPNVGQELWDYVKVTDSISGDTRIGNIQYIGDDVEVFPGTDQRATWRMIVSFGKVTMQSLQMGAIRAGEEARLSNAQIQSYINDLADRITILDNNVDKLYDWVEFSLFASVAQTSAGLLLYKAVTPNSLAGSIYGVRVLRTLKPALTRWVLPGWYGSWTTSTHVAGRIVYTPIFVYETTTYIRIGINVNTAAAGTCDLRIFNWSSGLPGSLVLSAGTVDTGTTGDKEITISQELTYGYYFLASRCSGAPKLRGLSVGAASSPPVSGFAEDNSSGPYLILLAADAAYADPAPAPTMGLESVDAAVRLREN